MTAAPPNAADVYRELLERISLDTYRAGSKLPSCRTLAEELGSNASTVDRAISRLVEVGLVRTVPRRGAFVVGTDPPAVATQEEIADHLQRVLGRAWQAGVVVADIRRLVEDALETLESRPRIGFVECNRRDLQHMRALVQRATGIDVQPILLADAWGRLLDDEFDVVATPTFHLNDLTDLVRDFDRVVEVNFVAPEPLLRRLIALRGARRLVAAAPTARGVQWMTALVGQYYPGPIEPFHIGSDDPTALEGVDVAVRTNAARLPGDHERLVPDVVSVEWELDPRFAGTFNRRIEDLLARKGART